MGFLERVATGALGLILAPLCGFAYVFLLFEDPGQGLVAHLGHYCLSGVLFSFFAVCVLGIVLALCPESTAERIVEKFLGHVRMAAFVSFGILGLFFIGALLSAIVGLWEFIM